MSPRRAFRRVHEEPELDPATFTRRLAGKIGTDYARVLTRVAFTLVESSGEPEPWVREARRARDAGEITPEIAHFLIWKFVESAMLRVVDADPELRIYSARMEAAERAEGLDELESFYVGEGPPEWEEARLAWEDAFDTRHAALLRASGEAAMADRVLRKELSDPAFEAGRAAIFGPMEEPRLDLPEIELPENDD